jgi:hypothetical protein
MSIACGHGLEKMFCQDCRKVSAREAMRRLRPPRTHFAVDNKPACNFNSEYPLILVSNSLAVNCVRCLKWGMV